MDEAGPHTQSKVTKEKLERGLGYLLQILLDYRIFYSKYQFLPLFCPSCLAPITQFRKFLKESFTETGKCLQKFLIKNFQQNIQKFLTVFNCEVY